MIRAKVEPSISKLKKKIFSRYPVCGILYTLGMILARDETLTADERRVILLSTKFLNALTHLSEMLLFADVTHNIWHDACFNVSCPNLRTQLNSFS